MAHLPWLLAASPSLQVPESNITQVDQYYHRISLAPSMAHQVVQFCRVGLLRLAKEGVLGFGSTFVRARLLLFLQEKADDTVSALWLQTRLRRSWHGDLNQSLAPLESSTAKPHPPNTPTEWREIPTSELQWDNKKLLPLLSNSAWSSRILSPPYPSAAAEISKY